MSEHRSPFHSELARALVRSNVTRHRGGRLYGRKAAATSYRVRTGLPMNECHAAISNAITEMGI